MCTCVHVCVFGPGASMLECHDTNLEVRVQLSGVSSCLTPCGFGGTEAQVIRLGGGHSYPQSHVACPIKTSLLYVFIIMGEGHVHDTHTHT